MQKNVKRFLLALLLLCSSASAEIIEIKSVQEISNYLYPETLLLFDIDNTLIEPVQTLGSDQWFDNQKVYYQDKGLGQSTALEKALAEMMSVQNVTAIKIVEEGTAELIAKLQKEGYSMMGLTARGLGLSTRTLFQLASLGIDLDVTAPTRNDLFFINYHGVLFRGGILFTAGTNEGMALLKFLHLINYKFGPIVFINDKLQPLQDVQQICEKYDISFTGLRYGYLDEKVKSYNPQIARVEFENFGKIISDKEAEKLLQSSSSNAKEH